MTQALHPLTASERFADMPSTVIRRFDYDAQTDELLVEFVTGRRYIYSGVPQEEADAMRSAFSKGSYFNRRIRDSYPYRELECASDQ